MIPPVVDSGRVLDRIRDDILAAGSGRILRIVLYGSRAVGTAGPDSDYDVLVVESDPIPAASEALRLRKALETLPCPIDLRVMGEQEFEETRDIVGGIAYPASRNGVTLYAVA